MRVLRRRRRRVHTKIDAPTIINSAVRAIVGIYERACAAAAAAFA